MTRPDLTIHFITSHCVLGALLVAGTARGICAIQLGDDAASLVRELQQRFPAAELLAGDAELQRITARVANFIEAPASDFTLPLDIQGSAFQQRVWQVLRDIPPGNTVSYGELARRIGAPGAARAVASACAANALAVVIPCHRVVRSDGELSGYRWGPQRKRALLELERRAVS